MCGNIRAATSPRSPSRPSTSGADAELVRGFITTPIERAIAAADGIDYIQSQSAQRASTITARLKLNYDANKALSDISSQRRRDPQQSSARIPDSRSSQFSRPIRRFASAYLSFTSDILQPNEVTDYLVRAGAAAADGSERSAEGRYSRRAHLRHAHLDEAGANGGIEHQPIRCPRRAFAK